MPSNPSWRWGHSLPACGSRTSKPLASSGRASTAVNSQLLCQGGCDCHRGISTTVSSFWRARALLSILHSSRKRALLGIQAGTDLVFGSDWPVAPSSPLLGVYAAIHRRSPDEAFGSGFHMSESLTADEALVASTRDAATASGLQDSLGTLR